MRTPTPPVRAVRPALLFLPMISLLVHITHLSAQIVIKEKVEVQAKERSETTFSVSSGPATLRMELIHNGSVRTEPNFNRYMSLLHYGSLQTVQLGSGVSSVSLAVYSGTTTYSMDYTIYPNPAYTRTLNWYVDDELLQTLTSPTSNCSAGCRFAGSGPIVLYNDFKFSHPYPAGIIPRGSSTAALSISEAWANPPTTATWHPNLRTTVTITKGADLGVLVHVDGTPIGNSFTGKASEIAKLKFMANGRQPRFPSETVRLTASSRGIEKWVEFQVQPVVERLALELESDTVRFNKHTKIWVTLYGDDGSELQGFENVQVNLTKSTDRVSFVHEDLGILQGSSVYVKYGDLRSGKIALVGRSIGQDGSQFRGDLRAQYHWYYEEKSFVVIAGSMLDHFAVTLEKDTIAFTEMTRIFVQAKDKDSNNVELDGSKRLSFEIETNDEFGTFIDYQGDTLKANPVILRDVLYQDAKDGWIRFAAVKKNPDSVVACRIRVVLQEDDTKTGWREIPVVEQTLKIVMIEPREVRPSIPTEDRDAAMMRLRRKPFEVQMTRSGKPVADHPFRLRSDYVRGSGGHDHGDTPTVVRENNNDNYGYFTAGQATTRLRPLENQTGADGRFSATYHASIWGDTMKVYLESRDPKKERFLKDSVTVVEKVSGLINFRNLASNGRWTLSQTPTGETRHVDNNWCTQVFADSIRLAIQQFYNWSLSEEGGGRAIVVSLNDMSLLFGGRFDISGTWDGRDSQQHLYHRIGTSVDVNQTLTDTQVDKLTTFMERRGLLRNQERPQIHYGSDRGN